MVRTTRATAATALSSPGKKGQKNKDAIDNIFDDDVQIHRSDVYCICRKPDIGTPMIHCGICKEWFHFDCVNITEDDAADVNIFVCPSCVEKTGRRTAMIWEGDHAVEIFPGGQPLANSPTPKPARGSSSQVKHEPQILQIADSDDEISNDSEDEFVVGERQRRSKKSRPIASNSSSESESEMPRISKKRRSQSTTHPPPAKRKKVKMDTPATDDPARKYCLGKFQDLFRDIFLRYPHLSNDRDGDPTLKTSEELTEEEKSKVLEQATRFATELETCIFDTYGEPDKQGDRHAGPKYKDRFRMLQFNLSKTDRVVLHRRIALGAITPKEISLMSSTDLANEETKQSIKEMEKEALEHSILQRTTAPRAKLTHKGLQDIEDVNGSSRDPDQELREREKENDEKREKERFARLKPAQESRQGVQEQRARTASFSSVGGGMGSPLSSPVAPSNPSWGGPPPLPSHMLANAPMTTTEDASAVLRARPPLFPNPSEVDNVPGSELELNLADLINIDDEPSVDTGEGTSTPPALASSTEPAASLSSNNVAPSSVHDKPTVSSPLSPSRQRATSFDLNSIWSGNPSTPEDTPTNPEVSEEPKDMEMEGPESVSIQPNETDDVDFDMILNDKETGQQTASAEDLQEAFDALPPVWSGKVSMPLDSATPQEPGIAGRQVGGRHIPPDSPLWRTLFPSDILRIDGRVPVDKSREYLLSMRMSPTKELVSVAFSPVAGGDIPFGLLLDFLIHKGRHGLVFPWGQRPKDHCPGRELYMVPLLASNPLPDFIELLDDLKLPKIRCSNYLIGIWILNKGKLVAPQPPPPSPNPNSVSLGQIQPSVLAAEMASLTPEQVQLMLRTLSASGVSLPGLGGVPPPPAAAPSYPSQGPPSVPRWPSHPSAPGPSQHPLSPSQGHAAGPQQSQAYRGPPGLTHDYDNYEDHRGGQRGPRGGHRGSNRGRGGHDDSSRGRERGWPRR